MPITNELVIHLNKKMAKQIELKLYYFASESFCEHMAHNVTTMEP